MSPFTYQRRYRGPVQAVIFDWAGTVVDFGSQAPAAVFVEVFRRQGVEISMEHARGPMGMYKLDHIRELTRMPAIAERWQHAHGRAPTEADVETMYQAFIPLQIECIASHADLVPGCLETMAALRARGIKIGSNTGYNKEMMQILTAEAQQRGFQPDSVVCSNDVSIGRPAPWMSFENARQMDVYPMESIVKVDDTIPGIDEGLNAGSWTVGVVKTGNEIGLSLEEVEGLEPAEYQRRMAAGYHRLATAGAHYVIDGIADLMPCLDDIERRLAAGEKP
jgi:phosphonoacetaldehyde hydrolase